MRQKSFFPRKIVKRNEALAVVVFVAGAAAQTGQVRVHLRRLNGADQAGKSCDEIAHIAFDVAQVVMPHPAFGEVFQVFHIDTFNGRAVAHTLPMREIKTNRLIQRAGFQPLLKLGVFPANLVHFQAERLAFHLGQGVNATVFFGEVLGAGAVAMQTPGNFSG
jgi:hypothetical protein